MSRRANTNYTAGGTDFDVVVGNEPFLMADIQRVQAALEGHDHSATKGLPVARVGNGSIGTTQLADLSVTAGKIALGAVGVAQLTAETPRYATGSYVGNGASTRTIALAFTPKLTFISTVDEVTRPGAVICIGNTVLVLTDDTASVGDVLAHSDTSVGNVTGGIKVGIHSDNWLRTNTNGKTYNYVAFG